MKGSVMMVVFFSAAFLAQSAGAQTKSIDICREPFKLINQSGDRLVVSQTGGYPGTLTTMCMPDPHDFVAEDSRILLSGVRLTRPQNDSVAAIRKSFLVLQGNINNQTVAGHREKQDSLVKEPPPQRRADPRTFYLTQQMRTLREQLLLALRNVVTPEQLPRFKQNIATLKKKDAGN